MSLGEEEYFVLQMLIEHGWRIPQNPDATDFMKPRKSRRIPGGNVILVRLRHAGFLNDKNQITEAGRQAFKDYRPPAQI